MKQNKSNETQLLEVWWSRYCKHVYFS